MTNRIIYRKEAEEFLTDNGWKLFLDMIIRDKAIIFDDLPAKTAIDIDIDKLVIIRRNGKIIYEE